MTTLVGRECWTTTGGVLRHGIVRVQRFDPDVCSVEFDGPLHEQHWVSSHALLLSVDDAIAECEEAENYWTQKAKELRLLPAMRNTE